MFNLARSSFTHSARAFSTSSRSQSFARLTLVGNLTREPEVRLTKNEKEYVSYTVATRNDVPAKADEPTPSTFHRILAFSPGSKDYLTKIPKGALVYVEAGYDVREADPDAEAGSFAASRQILLKHAYVLLMPGIDSAVVSNDAKSVCARPECGRDLLRNAALGKVVAASEQFSFSYNLLRQACAPTILSTTLMKPLTFPRFFAVAAAYLYYRSRDIYIFTVPPALPAQYFAHGNASDVCTVIHDPASERFRYCEDVIAWDVPEDRNNKHLILSCDPGRKAWNTVMGPLNDPAPRGDLWLYSYSAATLGTPRRLALEGFPVSASFHPLGIDVIPNASEGDYRLFVINHGEHRSTIEIFSLPSPSSTDVKATYLRTLSHTSFVSPNAVHALSPTSFYVSNDHTLTRRIRPSALGAVLALTETLSKFRGGWVDRVEFSIEAGVNQTQPHLRVDKAATGIPFANGLAVSPDGRTVAVASSNELAVLVYDRDVNSDKLSYAARVPTPFHADNLSFDAKGAIIVAGHPSFPSLIRLAKSKHNVLAPSWVVSITPQRLGLGDKEQKWKVVSQNGPFTDTEAPFPSHVRAPIAPRYAMKTLYQSDGTGYSGSSSAVWDGDFGRLFVVGLYGSGMLQCNSSQFGGPQHHGGL